jgi:hypothetical protein
MLAFKTFARRRETALIASTGSRAMASLAAYEDFGKNVFTGKVADEYLKKHGSSKELLNNPNWVNADADTVANAVFDWCVTFWLSRILLLEICLFAGSLILLFVGPSIAVPMSIATGSNQWVQAGSATV